MLTLYVLAVALTLVVAAYAALGVEDNQFHSDYVAIRYEASPVAEFWEDSLPGKPSLPWNRTTAEWVAAIEGK